MPQGINTLFTKNAARDVPPRVAEAVVRVSAPEGGIRAVPEVADGLPGRERKPRTLATYPYFDFAYRLMRGPGPLFAALCRKFTPVPGRSTSAARDVPPRVAEAGGRDSAPEGGIRAAPEAADGPPFAQGVRRVLRIKARAIARVRVRVEAVREVGARVSRVESHARDIAPPRRGRRRETIRKRLIGRADCVVRDLARLFANSGRPPGSFQKAPRETRKRGPLRGPRLRFR